MSGLNNTLCAEEVARDLAPFAHSIAWKSWSQLLLTVGLFVAGWLLTLLTYREFGYLASLLVAIPTSGMILRLFMIQHDCGHGAFFRATSLNSGVGRFVSLFTLIPYDCWRKTHSAHHATSGNLGRRGVGDIVTMTVKEFEEASPTKRFFYRVYRNPIVFLVGGPIYYFIWKMRLPNTHETPWKPNIPSVLATNVAGVILLWSAASVFGWAATLAVHGTMLFLVGSVGLWLFFVQHQFETAYWRSAEEWTFHEAALASSSYFHFPQPLRWFTANIGIHHVHHLCSRIPFYRLPDCLKVRPELAGLNRFQTRETFRMLSLALWNEDAGRMVTFAEARHRIAG